MYTVKKILVPTDYSEVSRAALSVALQVADRHDAEIYLLHVQEEVARELRKRIVTMPDEDLLEKQIDDDEKSMRQMIEVEYKRARYAGFELKRVPIHLRVTGGDWLEVALELIEEEMIDLVVSGTHGPQGLKSFLLGTVTEQLVHRATCSVFVVKPPGYPYLRD